MQLVLSIFPGLDLLGRAFEEVWPEAYVVRGQDPVWGGEVRNEHPPAGRFDGVIGGPPCQAFSVLANLVRHNGHEPRFGNLIPEYERIVREAQPRWALMEEVPGAPLPEVEGYERWATLITDSHVGGVQPRERRFTLLLRPELWPHIQSPWTLLEYEPHRDNGRTMSTNSAAGAFGDTRVDPDSGRPPAHQPLKGQATLADSRPIPVAIGGSGKRKQTLVYNQSPANRDSSGHALKPQIADMCEAQGLPRDFFDAIEAEVRHKPFTKDGQRHLLGNGVPMAMGRAVARVVKRITEERL